MSIKYKQFILSVGAITSLVLSTLTMGLMTYGAASADPIPSCGGGSVLTIPTDPNQPAYCKCPDGQTLVTGNPNTCVDSKDASKNCATGSSGVDYNGNSYCNQFLCADGTQPANDDPQNCGKDPAATSGNCDDVSKCDLISTYINPAINFASALVGVAVVASIIIGAIQYGSSAGDPQKATAAKNRIRNSIIALLTFLFLFALINFLVPGGLLG